ncbi:MAG: hypothetical protein EXS15_06065 [Phycisphaerales bacterium]|nr:hypothetical protein [Phycisphaerales bacterium]
MQKSTRSTILTAGVIAGVMAGVIALLFAGLALLDTAFLARFFTHEVLAKHAGVAVRAVTIEGAQWFRVNCVLSAVAWVTCGIFLVRQTRPLPRAHGPTDTRDGRVALRAVFALVSVVVLGVALRVDRIAESFWFDEICALVDYGQYGPGAIMGTYFVQSNHVLHTLACWVVMKIAGGVSEPLLRAPAFGAGLASIVAIAMLMRECARWRRVSTQPLNIMSVGIAGGIAAGIASLLPILVLESVEARGYSMMILFSALASWQFLSAWRMHSPVRWLCYALVCVLGVWSHLACVALPLSHGVIALWLIVCPRQGAADRRDGVAALSALVLAAITTITVLSPLLPDLLRIRREFQALDGNEPSMLSLEGFHILLGIGGAWTVWAALPGVALVIIGIAGCRRDIHRRIPLAVTLVGLPMIVVGTELAGSWMYARFALFALPGLICAMTFGAWDLSWMKRSALACGAFATAALWIISLKTLPPKQPIRDAVDFIRAQDPALTTIASVGLEDNVVIYYGVLAGLDVSNAGSSDESFDSITAETNWLVLLYPRSLTSHTRLGIAQDWQLVVTFPGWVDWNNGDVSVYRRTVTAVH